MNSTVRKERAAPTVRFNVEAAIDTLSREAIATGIVPGPAQKMPAHMIAMSHLHGIQRDACTHSPCRMAGICHALWELAQYQEEAKAAKPLLDAARETEHVRKTLTDAGRTYAPALVAVHEHGKRVHQFVTESGGGLWTHDHDLLCVHPERVLHAMNDLLSVLAGFDEALRALVSSPELRQPGTKRRADLLLTAVYQHLRWGGLTYREIASLVPDGSGGAGAEERVRARVKAPNARSLLPYDPAGRTKKASRAEKSRRRVSSG